MSRSEFEIERYEASRKEQLISLSMRAWKPVFELLEAASPAYVYNAFYPDGWRVRQTADIEAFLAAEGDLTWVAVENGEVLGFVGARMHPEDRMGEIYILAVDPSHQRRGIATALMDTATAAMRAEDLSMVMVETGGDPGHSGSRATYEAAGFERWPVARYFKPL
ncbi:MAG: GNAT family N-acetyltransferase [Pseudomonadota bacterium]